MTDYYHLLSGNVPGGFLLYLLVVIVIIMVLYFMYRVNEFFTRKIIVRSLIISIILVTFLYAFIWYKNPPPHVLKRYTIGLIQSDTPQNWFGEYVTDFISANTRPYISSRSFLFPHQWFYKITPTDSALEENFLKRSFTLIPVEFVLTGNIQKQGKKFHVALFLNKSPGFVVQKSAEADFNIFNLAVFLDWLKSQFGEYIPFKTESPAFEFYKPDSLYQLARRNFFMGNYEQVRELLKSKGDGGINVIKYDLLDAYTQIKISGEESLAFPKSNPYDPKLTSWEKELKNARDRIVNIIRSGKQDNLADLMVAESYIWQRDYASAEIFLEKAHVDNPFDIDVLLNLSFLHPSRYKEFGFSNIENIMDEILYYCPIDEPVLLRWSENILEGNPAYTAPPKKARRMVEKYLEINPHSYKAWLMLGKILAQNLERDMALKTFMKADSILPNNGVINYNIGVLLYEWHQSERALDYLNKSIEYDNYLDSYLYLGTIYEEQGQYQKALEYFRYRVSHRKGENDYYAIQAMKGIRKCLDLLGEQTTN
jgi:tetratricopeptide (TPR) repeat protein